MGLAEVRPDGIANDRPLRLRPTDPPREAVDLQTQERPQRQPDVVPLRLRLAALAPLDAGTLLDPTVVMRDRQTAVRHPHPLQTSHRQVVGRPVRGVAIRGDDPEHLDPPETRQPDLRPGGRDGRHSHRLRPPPVEVDQPDRLEPGQSGPSQRADRLEVVRTAVPAVERHAPGPERAGEGGPDRGREVAVSRSARRPGRRGSSRRARCGRRRSRAGSPG